MENKQKDPAMEDKVRAGDANAPQQAEEQPQQAKPEATEPPANEAEELRNAFRKASGGKEGIW